MTARVAMAYGILLAICCALSIAVEGRVSFSTGFDPTDGHLVNANRALQDSTEGRIARGDKAPCGRYPYMVSLRTRQNVHNCGGVLVAPEYVLTAAHCVDPNEPGTLGLQPVVVIGGCNLDDDIGSENKGGIVERFPGTAIIHENYTKVRNGSDIALVKLNKPSKNTPAFLSEPSKNNNLDLVAIGWGKQEDDTSPRDLQQATELTIIPRTICDTDEDAWDTVDILESMICAIGIGNGQDSCKGDSGGPLLEADAPNEVVEDGDPELDKLVGLVSFGPAGQDCGKSTKPGVYTKLMSFRPWILEKMNEGKEPGTVLLREPPVSPPPKDSNNEPKSETNGESTAPAPGPDETSGCFGCFRGVCVFCPKDDGS